jgi:hypothetical protein
VTNYGTISRLKSEGTQNTKLHYKMDIIEKVQLRRFQNKRNYIIMPTRTRRAVKAEEGGPGKVCLYHDQGTHKGAERKFYKDGYGGQGRGGFLKQRTRSMSVSPSYLLNMYK